MIRESILIAGIIYLAVIMIQVLTVSATLLQGVIVGILILAGTGFYFIRHHELLEHLEIVALWSVILLFVVYALLRLWGVV
jgi:hypothetical protein